jgi:hypothetical protein
MMKINNAGPANLQNFRYRDRGRSVRMISSCRVEGYVTELLGKVAGTLRVPSATAHGVCLLLPAAEDLAWAMLNSTEFLFNH